MLPSTRVAATAKERFPTRWMISTGTHSVRVAATALALGVAMSVTAAAAHAQTTFSTACSEAHPKCTTVLLSANPLIVTVSPSGKIVSADSNFVWVTVSHHDRSSSCEKIYAVEAETFLDQHSVTTHPLPGGGSCTITNLRFPMLVATRSEINDCPGTMHKYIGITPKSHNVFGQLTTDDSSNVGISNFDVVVNCEKLTPSALTLAAYSYTGACQSTGGPAVASFQSNDDGVMDATWTFGTGAKYHLQTRVRRGANQVSYFSNMLPATTHISSTVTLQIAAPGGTVSSATVPYVNQCVHGAQATTNASAPAPAPASGAPRTPVVAEKPVNAAPVTTQATRPPKPDTKRP